MVLISALLATLLFLCDFSSTQQCVKQVTTNWRAQCPPFPSFLNEAFTLERNFKNGSKDYLKMCCDPRGVAMLRAHAQSCHTTECLTTPHPFYNKPCSSFTGRFIVDSTYVKYRETMRETCEGDSGADRGIVAICCPPNSNAGTLLSMYGVEPNEFPHQARVLSELEMCGATVYNKNYLITAAHCVVNKQGTVRALKNTTVVLGTTVGNLMSKKNVFPVEKIIVHEDFSMNRNHPEFRQIFQAFKRIFNDIALLKLGRSIDFERQPEIRALPLAPPNFKPENYANHVVMIGWGITDFGAISEYLQKANLLLRSDRECFKPFLRLKGNRPYPNTRQFSNQLICTGGILNGQVSPIAGQGDSGGPTICRGPDGYAVHCGVISFGGNGDLCTRRIDELSCRPTVVADVSYFRNWIIQHAGQQDPRTLHKVKLYGDFVGENEALHQVLITSNEGDFCGGTLVSPDVVITAGHCVLSDTRKVHSGIQILTRNGWIFKPRSFGGVAGLTTFGKQNFLDAFIERRGEGRLSMSPPFVDDIAIIKLEKKVAFTRDKFLKLRKSRNVDLSRGKEFSFSNVKMNGLTTFKLVARDFRILDAKECRRRLNALNSVGIRSGFDWSRIKCGVEWYSGGTLCDRPLGGGLICGNKNEEILCGVQTFRFCDTSLPSVFLDVAKYLDSIEEIMKMA